MSKKKWISELQENFKMRPSRTDGAGVYPFLRLRHCFEGDYP